MIPNLAHFVFGLDDRPSPFHFLHYLAIESCRRVVEPTAIYLHCRRPPSGRWWEAVADAVTLVEVDLVPEVLSADYSAGLVPERYRYAHHADFVRLDALLEHGGIYADLDTIFLRPPPAELYEAPFVIGREPPVHDEVTGALRPSLCNALLMAEPGSRFARVWREEMPAALNGTWSNHSGFLADSLAGRLPEAVRVEPEVRFFPFPATSTGIRQLLDERHPVTDEAVSLHLWGHLWWQRRRRDHSLVHAGWCTPEVLAISATTLADLARPYLPPARLPQRAAGGATVREAAAERATDDEAAAERAADGRAADGRAAEPWIYCSFDEASGYGTAADRCRAALGASGVDLRWVPFARTFTGQVAYAPPNQLRPFPPPSRRQDQVVVGHLVPEYLPELRAWCGDDAFLVAHTAWETDRIPAHWPGCLEVADLVVVPSSFSAAAFEAAEIRIPLEVVPHVAPPLVPAGPSRFERFEKVDPGRFVFYTIGDWTPRKALRATVEAYLQAFRRDDPVLLVVKTSPRAREGTGPATQGRTGPGSTAFALASLLARYPDHPPVSLVTEELTEEEIAGLHARGDCFLSLTRGEGFGLGAFDAAVNGNPVVVTGWGGQLEFLDGAPFLVAHRLVPVEDQLGFASYTADQRWAEADLDHAVAQLRRVVAEREEAVAEAARRAEHLRARHAPAAVAAAFEEAVGRWRDVRVTGRRRGGSEPAG